MPSYQYECQNCHAHVELVQSVEKHEPPAACPSCSMQHTMVRVFNPLGSNAEEDQEKLSKE